MQYRKAKHRYEIKHFSCSLVFYDFLITKSIRIINNLAEFPKRK